MWGLNRMEEKIAVNCASGLVEKEIFLDKNGKKDSPTYKIYSLQNLYDLTSIKNGNNIDLAANLIYNAKKVSLIVNKKDENIKNLIVEIAKSFEPLGISVLIFDDASISKLEKNDVVIKLNLKSNAKDKLSISERDLKTINIYLKKSGNCNERGINLYGLKLKNIDPLLSIEVLLKCVYLGVLSKM